MMIRCLFLFALVWLSLPVGAQHPDLCKMSGLVRQAAIGQMQRSRTRSGADRPQVITAFVRTDGSAATEVLSRYGCRSHGQWGDIVIAEIPLEQLAALSREPGVRRIEAGRSAELLMDTTATVISALPVYEPQPDGQTYTGRGVVVGLVDVGFDLTHPTFYDAQASHYRIGAFWDQLSKDTVGSRMPVGRDYVGPETVRAVASSTDAPKLTHGTHTSGIAAGSGYDTPYRGIAYDSELCLVGNVVSSNVQYIDSASLYKYTTATDALAFKYCFDYAASQRKPCVVSMSEGYPPYLDEDDSLYAAVLDSLSGPGRIIVASAGNVGIVKAYFEKPAGVAAAGAFVSCSSENAIYKLKADGPLQLVLYYYGGTQGVPSDTLSFSTAQVPADTILSSYLVCDGDTLGLKVYRDRSRFGSEDIWQVLVAGSRPLSQLKPIALVTVGTGRVEAYGGSSYAFRSDAADSRWSSARQGHDIYAPGCFPAVVCVGATAHRLSILNPQGQIADGDYHTPPGHVWEYSSTGPSMNGLIKPDVVAPGTNVVSAYSHYYHPERHVVATSEYGGEQYPWGADSGTSMSAPVVAGVIALWLQARPDLSPDDIRAVLARSCRQPETALGYPNNAYGYGEIDAYRGLLEVLGLTGIGGISHHQPDGVRITPARGALQLRFSEPLQGADVSLRVYSLTGVCVHSDRLRVDGRQLSVALPASLSGVHVVQVECGSVRGSSLLSLVSGL